MVEVRERREYTNDFKLGAVTRVAAGETMKAVAEDLDIHPNLIRNWRQSLGTVADLLEPKEPEVDDGEVMRLRRDNALLQAEIDYLKRRETILRR